MTMLEKAVERVRAEIERIFADCPKFHARLIDAILEGEIK